VGMGLVLLLNYQMQKKKKASENGENIETAVSEKPNEK